MDMVIQPHRLEGAVTPPASKSLAHRLLLAAALAAGESTITGVSASQDVAATLRCTEALGASWRWQGGDTIRVSGAAGNSAARHSLPQFDCGESGSTLRFLIPISLVMTGGGVFTGYGRLMERPQQPYFDLFDRLGIFYQQRGGQLTVRGRLTPGAYQLPGNVSSQFFTGLLLALALPDGVSSVLASTEIESADYIAMTIHALSAASVPVAADWQQGRFTLTGGGYRAFTASVEADWSQAAFWYAANFLGSRTALQGLNPHSPQGDRVVDKLARTLRQSGDVQIDLSGCPDLLPPLAVMAAVRQGQTQFIKAGRLRLKESDRLTTTAAMLTALGAQAAEQPDGLIVRGGVPLSGGTVDGANDHRIVMAAAMAATACRGAVTITGADAVKKSYPSFFEEYQRLGGVAHVL